MPETGKITEIIDIQACKSQISEVTKALHTIVDELVDISRHGQQMQKDFGGIQGTQTMINAMKELEAANNKAMVANEKLSQALKAKSALEEKLAKLTTTRGKEESGNLGAISKLEKKLTDLRSDEAKRVFELKRQIAELTAQRKHEAQMIDAAKTSIINMERQVRLLTDAYDRMSDEERRTAKGKELQEKIKKLNVEIREQKVAMGNMKANVGNYRQSLENLEATMKETTMATKRFKDAMVSLKSGNISAGFTAISSGAQVAKNKMASFSASVVTGVRDMIVRFSALAASAYGVYYSIKKWMELNGTLSDSLAAVRRTTGMTQDEVFELNETLRKFNSRTAQRSLLDLAHVAGKLGVAKNDIAGFVRAADMIGVALGKDLGDNEEAINQLGRLVQIFKLQNSRTNLEKALLNIGSALKDLGNASVAEEKNILEFTKRIGGIAPIADMSIDKVMGLGATFDILGQSMEVSATASTRVWIAMGQHPEKFAKIAGKPVKEFIKLMKTDFNQAFVDFVKGLNRSDADLVTLANDLDGLGIEGYRTIQALSVLSDKTELYAEQTRIAKESMEKGTTAAKQFAIQNESLGASFAKLGKTVSNFVANAYTIAGLKWVFDGLTVTLERLFNTGTLTPVVDTGNQEIGKTVASYTKLKLLIEELQRLQADKKKAQADGSLHPRSFLTERDNRIKVLKDEIYFTQMALEQQNQQAENEQKIIDLKNQETDRLKLLGQMNEDGTQKTKAQLKLEKQQAAQRAKELKEQQKHDNALEKLQDKADSLMEKSWDLRTQYGLTSLQEQEEHEKNLRQKEIDDLNEKNKQEMLLQADATAKVEHWTAKQLADRKKQIIEGSQWEIINKEQTEEVMYAITMKYVDKCQQAEEEGEKTRKKVLEDYKKRVGDNTISLQIDADLSNSSERLDELQQLREKLKNREITVKEYKQREYEINQKYDLAILNKSIEIAEDQINKLKAVGIETLDLEQKLADLKIALNKKVADDTIENAERAKGREEEINKELYEKSRDLFGSITNLISVAYQNRITTIEDEVQANKDAWDVELERANGNQKLEEEINRKRSRQEKQLNAEKKKATREQAEANKLVSIFNATINTSVGVTGALTQTATMGTKAIALAVLIGLMGASEILAIASEKIPQYAKGRKGGKATWAVVGEKGSEALQYPSGETRITPDEPTITYLPFGTSVIPHEELIRSAEKFGNPSLSSRAGNNYTVNVTDPYGKEMLNEMKKKKPETIITYTDKHIIYQTGNYRRITSK